MQSHALGASRLPSCVDAMLIAVSLAAVWPVEVEVTGAVLFAVLLVVPANLFLFRFFGVYESQRLDALRTVLQRVFSAQICAAVAGAVLCVVTRPAWLAPLGQFISVATVFIIVQKLSVYVVLHWLRRRGMDARYVCVIGDSAHADALARRFAAHPEWASVVACVGSMPLESRRFQTYPDGADVGSTLDDALTKVVIDEVVVAVPAEDLVHERGTLRACEEYGLPARVVLPALQTPGDTRIESCYGDPGLAVGKAANGDVRLVLKRAMDIILASALLIALAPLMFLVAVLVKLSSSGPVIFTQTRIGLHGRKFRFLKFRSMVHNTEAIVTADTQRSRPVFIAKAGKDPNDLRVTPIGRILRRFSLDELPQLFNVLKGDMSIVGPRPLTAHSSAFFAGALRRRFTMRPGITGLWQVGARGNFDFEVWAKYDLQYVEQWSLGLDAKVLLRTIPVVLTGRDAC